MRTKRASARTPRPSRYFGAVTTTGSLARIARIGWWRQLRKGYVVIPGLK